MTLRSKVLAAMATICLLLLSVAMSPPASAGGYKAGCNNKQGSFQVREGSLPIRIGHVGLNVHYCWNNHGHLTTSSAVQTSGLTGPAWTAGWHIDLGAPIEGGSHPGNAQSYVSEGDANLCVLLRVAFCGYTEDFNVAVNLYAPAFVGPQPPPFSAYCTNSHCHLKFTLVH